MIIEDMRNTGVMGNPAEWFIPWASSGNKTGKNWERALENIRQRATGSGDLCAIKVMANQIDPVNERLSQFITTTQPGIFPAFAEVFSDFAWIRLIRRDVVSQAISRVMSQQTGIMHATRHKKDYHFAGKLQKGYDPSYNSEVVYDYRQILKKVQSIVLENLIWERFFESNGSNRTELYYEDVVADPNNKHLDIIAQEADITAHFNKYPRKLVKMANERNIAWRDAFFEDAVTQKFNMLK